MKFPTAFPSSKALFIIFQLVVTIQLFCMYYPYLTRLPRRRTDPSHSHLHCHGDDDCFPFIHDSLSEDVSTSIQYCKNNSAEMDRENPRIATVTAQFGEPQHHYQRALRTHLVHSIIHGTDVHVLCENIVDDLWNKPAFILSILLDELAKPKEERLEWLMWVDRDTIVLDNCRSPASFLPPAPGWAANGPDPAYITKRDKFPKGNIHLLATTDWNGLNNGVFLLRVNRWSVDLFDSILSYRHYKPDVELKFTEQSAIELLLQEEKFRHNVTWVPQWWFNAYPGPQRDFTADEQVKLEAYHARPGDFLVHFAGVGNREDAMPPWLRVAELRTSGWAAGPTQRKLDYEVADFWRKRAVKSP